MIERECRFQSSEGRFGFVMRDSDLERLLQLCARAGHHETGGILVGHHDASLRWAVLTAVSEPPADSRGGTTWFFRGTKGLKSWLRKLWRTEHHFYLGEWHLHPNGEPHPSATDIEQMEEIARSSRYQCREPLLVIVGGLPLFAPQIAIYIFPHGEEYQQLLPLSEP